MQPSSTLHYNPAGAPSFTVCWLLQLRKELVGHIVVACVCCKCALHTPVHQPCMAAKHVISSCGGIIDATRSACTANAMHLPSSCNTCHHYSIIHDAIVHCSDKQQVVCPCSMDQAVESLSKGSKVWYKQNANTWQLAELRERQQDTCSIILPDGSIKHNVQLAHVAPANPDVQQGIADLTQLSYLNEPSILSDLEERYSGDFIYTNAGPVLIAVNPCKALPLYTADIARSYKGRLASQLPVSQQRQPVATVTHLFTLRVQPFCSCHLGGTLSDTRCSVVGLPCSSMLVCNLDASVCVSVHGLHLLVTCPGNPVVLFSWCT